MGMGQEERPSMGTGVTKAKMTWMTGLAKTGIATVLLVALASLPGCGDDVPPHPGAWDPDTSPLGEGYDLPHKDTTTSSGKTNQKTDDADADNRQPQGTKGRPDEKDEVQSKHAVAPSAQGDGGIWVRTHVKATLVDDAGDAMVNDYETAFDASGNAISTEVSSDDWSGTISYAFDGNGFRQQCSLDGDDDLWLPEFESGFLSLIGDEQERLLNTTDANGRLISSAIMDDDMFISYNYDQQGNLVRMISSEGFAEEYGADGLIASITEYDSEASPASSDTLEFHYTKDADGRLSGATLMMVTIDEDGLEQEEVGHVIYEVDEAGNIAHISVIDAEDEFGYRLDVECEYEYVQSPSQGARPYARMDRYGAFY